MMTDKSMDFLEKQGSSATKALEVLREELPLQRFVGESLSQAVVEGEVALPGGLREETTVLSAEAMAVLDRSAAEADRVTAEGKVVFHVLYTQGDPTHVSALEASAEFSHPVELAGAQSGMNAPVSLMVEHVEAGAQGGRLHLMAILRVQVRAFLGRAHGGGHGHSRGRWPDAAHRNAQRLSDRGGGRHTGRACARRMRPGRRSCRSPIRCMPRPFATVQDVMGGEERATLSGNILLEVVHRSAMPSRPLVVTRHTIPFEETVSLTGDEGDSLCAGAVVKDVAVLSQEGAGGGRAARFGRRCCWGLNAQAARQTGPVPAAGRLYHPGRSACRWRSRQSGGPWRTSSCTPPKAANCTLLLDGQTPVRTPLRAGASARGDGHDPGRAASSTWKA